MSREDRRAALLDSAAALVDERGAGALSFEALASAANVAPSLPYAYFDSKEDILLTLFDRVIGALDEQVRTVVLEDAADFRTIVRQALDVWFDAAREHGRLMGALLDGGSVPGLRAAVAQRDRASHKLWHDLVADRFSLEDKDAHVLAAMLNQTATATVELWLRRKGPRQGLTDAFVTMATGAAKALEQDD